MTKSRLKLKYVIAIALIVAATAAAFTLLKTRTRKNEAGMAMTLPPAEKSGGMPLMETLARRRSSRSFSDDSVPVQTLSNLLWAANGLSSEDGRRTAPTARNAQEIELYVIDRTGIYFFDYKNHSLERITDEDVTASASRFSAPLAIAIVADLQKAASRDMALADSGFVGQNIYLAATSMGLASVIMLSSFDRETMTQKLDLAPHQELIFIHAIGFPAK